MEVGGQPHTSATLPIGKEPPVLFEYEAESLVPAGHRTQFLGRSAQSLYRLSYPDTSKLCVQSIIQFWRCQYRGQLDGSASAASSPSGIDASDIGGT